MCTDWFKFMSLELGILLIYIMMAIPKKTLELHYPLIQVFNGDYLVCSS